MRMSVEGHEFILQKTTALPGLKGKRAGLKFRSCQQRPTEGRLFADDSGSDEVAMMMKIIQSVRTLRLKVGITFVLIFDPCYSRGFLSTHLFLRI